MRFRLHSPRGLPRCVGPGDVCGLWERPSFAPSRARRANRMVQPGAGETRLMITPGYNFRVVDRMLTNFHLPRSTLLMLVSAFAGHELTMAAYRHAIEQRYRFYSYGDAMVII